MKTKEHATTLRIRPAAWCMMLFLMLVCVGPALPGDPGILKLKICDCGGSELSGAYVEVTVERDGYGEVATDDGYSNGGGHISFSFGSLEEGDEAHVTVTPVGGNPDDSHTYVWSDNGDSTSEWDLVLDGSTCGDGWFNNPQNIILLRTDG